MGMASMHMSKNASSKNRTSNLACVRFFSFNSSCGMRNVTTPCTVCRFSNPLRRRTCLYMHLLIRNDSVQYLPLYNITGMCVKQSFVLSLSEIHVTMYSLFARSATAPFEHGGITCDQFSPLRITLYSVEFIDFIALAFIFPFLAVLNKVFF